MLVSTFFATMLVVLLATDTDNERQLSAQLAAPASKLQDLQRQQKVQKLQSARASKVAKAAKAKAKAAKTAAANAAFAAAKARDAKVVAAFESADNGGCAGHRFRWFEDGRCAPRTFKKRHAHKLAPPAERLVYVTSLSFGGTDQSASPALVLRTVESFNYL